MTKPHTIQNRLRDALLEKTAALPSAAGSTTTAYLDLGDGIGKGKVDCLLETPALATGIIGDGETVTLAIEQSADSTFATGVTTVASETFTGADAAGVAAASVRGRCLPEGGRYVRGKVTTGASTGDASGSEMTFSIRC